LALKWHQCPGEALRRDGLHAPRLRGVFRRLEGHMAKERMDRRQSQLAGSGRDPALGFKLVEEGGDQRCVDVLQHQRRRRLAQSLVYESQQQSDGIALRGDRVRAGASIAA
jgi:hypothetical protein